MRSIACILGFLIPLNLAFAEEKDFPKSLSRPLEEIVKEDPNRDVLVIFSADWDICGILLRRHLKTEVIRKILSRPNLEVYYADCTHHNSAGQIEMARHGVNANPPSAALQHRDGQITFTRLNLTSAETIAGNLRGLLSKAQPVAPSDGDKPSK